MNNANRDDVLIANPSVLIPVDTPDDPADDNVFADMVRVADIIASSGNAPRFGGRPIPRS
jgi:hypothetical protein